MERKSRRSAGEVADILSLLQPASNGKLLPPVSSFAKEQLEVSCKVLIAKFPTEMANQCLTTGLPQAVRGSGAQQ